MTTISSLESISWTDLLAALSDDEAKQLITCSVSSEPLTTAVILQPCRHRVNKSVAERIFAEMLNETVNSNYKICPSCKEAVTSYDSDEQTRFIVSLILKNRFNPSLLLEEMEDEKKESTVTKSDSCLK